MSVQQKKGSTTVDQMIEHMTADIQASDGQYIQLGFTPPATPNDTCNHHQVNQQAQHPPHNWQSEFHPHASANGNFQPSQVYPNSQYRMSHSFGPVDPINFPQANYQNFIPPNQNPVFMPELYDKHAPVMHSNAKGEGRPDLIPVMDMRNSGYILFNNMPQADVNNVCNYIYSENRDYNLISLSQQEIQNLQQIQRQNSQVFLENPNYIQHHHMEQPNIVLPSTQNLTQSNSSRTPLIENLVGNWTPNTSGTYSPFGNQTSPTNGIFETHTKDLSSAEGKSSQGTIKANQIDLNVKNTKNIKKPRMVAEVKPMRPSYSDVLTKSVPITIPSNPKQSKIETNFTKKVPVKKNGNNSKNSNKNHSRSAGSNDDKPTNESDKKKENIPPSQTSSRIATNSEAFEENLDLKKRPKKRFDEPFLCSNSSSSTSSGSSAASSSTTTPTTSMPNVHFKSNESRSSPLSNSDEFEWRESRGNEHANQHRANAEKINGKNFKKSKDKISGNASFSSVGRGVSERSSYGVLDKPNMSGGKRGHRHRRRDNDLTPLALFGRSFVEYMQRWLKLALYLIVWLFFLISDVLGLSIHLTKDLCTNGWNFLRKNSSTTWNHVSECLMRLKFFSSIVNFIDSTLGSSRWAFWNRGQKDSQSRNSKLGDPGGNKSWLSAGLENNITMPTTGEEAMKRLLACRGKDPYSILGVTNDCSDDDIKRYYKRQAFLVHPDKNAQPGAEEAFKILVHAFNIIGEPERRQSYDRKVLESHQVEQAWSELNDLISQLHQKMEYAANTIRCTNCTKRHRRIHVERPCYAARMCAQCKIHHSAREGDIWAESVFFGLLWRYYACMDGAVYNITEWASCQRANLHHLRPNTHQVQYRIVLGKQTGNGCSTSNTSNPPSSHRHKNRSATSNGGFEGSNEREPDLEEFLNQFYSHSGPSPGAPGNPTAGPTPTNPSEANARPDSARNRKKNKRKK